MVVVLAAGAGSCLAETRHALVIGNGQYGNVPALRNAVADARAMRDRLAATGFDVTYRENADRRSMNRAVDEFVGKLSSDSVALLYYAGHGVQIGATNYLIPTDIRADSASDVANDAVDLSRVLEKVTSTQARFALAIVDACRDNPFRVAGRSLGVQRGLAPPTTTADGVMVVYSAGANQAALDTLSDRDPDPNGVFTREWLRVMMTPGLSVQAVATQVRQSVASLARSVGHAQTPAVYDQSLGSFEFVPASATDSVPAPTSAAAAPPAPVAPSQPSSPPAPPPVLASALLLPQQPPLTTRTATTGAIGTDTPVLTGPTSSASKPNGPQAGTAPADAGGFDLGGLLKRAGDAGVGDYLMALGGGIASGRNWGEGLGNAFSAASRVGTQQQASRLADAELQLKVQKARQEQGALNANALLIKQAFPNLSDQQALGGAGNSTLVSAAISRMQNPNAGRDIKTDGDGVNRYTDTGEKVFADDTGKDDRTTDVKNYEAAVKGGFVGSLTDFMNRGQTPQVKTFTLSDGSKVDRVFDPATKTWKDPNFGDSPPRVSVSDNSDVPPGVDPETYRKELAKGAAAEQKGATQRALQASNAMPVLDRAQAAYERLAQNGGIGPISASGPSRMIAGAFGRQNEIDRQDYEAAAKDLELLKAQISMKGQGAITEGERRLLGMTLPRLDAASPEIGLTTLKGMRDQFTKAMGAQGLPTVGGGQQGGQQAPQPATASPQSVAPAARFQALTRGGMSKNDAFARMRQEGY